ncbi:MAG: hypothetical protein IPK07_13390 [Deltaproteobacteria bacterium]|nr:hypothetical protein [Deltaproteobacteria bacterium]
MSVDSGHRVRAVLVLVVALTGFTVPRARASLLFDRLSPTNGTNTVSVTVTLQGQPNSQTSQILGASTIDVDYDTSSHELRVVDAELLGSNVTFQLPNVELQATNLRVSFAPDIAVAPNPVATVNAGNGTFTDLQVPVRFTGTVSVNGGASSGAVGETIIILAGTFHLDPTDGSFALTSVSGAYGPLTLQLTQNASVQISGTTAVNFAADAPLDEIPGAARVGADVILTGRGLTAGSLLKLFVATSSGTVDVLPNGLAPKSVAADGTSGTWTLPWHWPVNPPDDVLLGAGFAAASVVRSDLGFSVSNSQGVVLLGNPTLSPPVPSITGIGGVLLSPTSSEESIATANVEGLIQPGSAATIQGDGFVNPVVNIFSASGNCAPQGGIVPSSSSSTNLTITVPAGCPVGPGSLQVINASGAFLGSNAVSIPIGEQITVTGVSVNGSTVTVDGSGFNTLTVINLFASSGGQLVNAGGLDGDGSPKIPLTIVSSQQFTFTRPGGLSAGMAYVQAINPPFIPFTNSGSSPAGSFTLP